MGGCQPYVNMENLACYSLVGEKTAPCSVGFSRFGVSTSMYATASLLRCAIGGCVSVFVAPNEKEEECERSKQNATNNFFTYVPDTIHSPVVP